MRGALDLMVKFGPSLAGLVTAAVTGGAAGLRDLVGRFFRAPLPWLLLALLLPLVVVQGAVAARLVVGGPVGPVALGVMQAAVMFAGLLATRFFLGGGMGEEFGWRGLMLPALQKTMDPLRASIWVGVAWALWHLPAYGLALIVFAPFAVALSVVFTFVYNRTGGSVLVVALLHASVNASLAGLEEVLPALDDEILVQVLVLGGWAVLALVLVRAVGAEGLGPAPTESTG